MLFAVKKWRFPIAFQSFQKLHAVSCLVLLQVLAEIRSGKALGQGASDSWICGLAHQLNRPAKRLRAPPPMSSSAVQIHPTEWRPFRILSSLVTKGLCWRGKGDMDRLISRVVEACVRWNRETWEGPLVCQCWCWLFKVSRFGATDTVARVSLKVCEKTKRNSIKTNYDNF